MAIKSGQILHIGNDVTLIERLQTGGPGNLNIPKDKIYELGNYQSVATIRDTPDLSYSLESLDTSCALESFLTGTALASTSFDLSTCQPVDLATPFKPGKNAPLPFTITKAVGIPFLYAESISYKFGLKDNAAQTVSLKGDSIFYCPGPVYVETSLLGVAAGGTLATTHVAGIYSDASGDRRVLSVEVGSTRLTYGSDYTVSSALATGYEVATVTFTAAVTAPTPIRIMYFSSVPQVKDQTIHSLATVKPAAVRGRDIDVYVGGYDPTSAVTWGASQANKWGDVQSVTCDWKVTLDKDNEFGNYFMTGQDFDVPTVDGSINLKPRYVDTLFARIREMTGETATDRALGPNTAVPLVVDIVIKNAAIPFDAADPAANTLKRLHIPDARFTVPGFSGRVQQKLTVDVPFESDAGTLIVYPV